MTATLPPAPVVFEPITHRYVHATTGEPIPNVTGILTAFGLREDFSNVPRETLERARERGTAVHAACHYYDDHDLDPTTVDDAFTGYLEAWKRFRDEHGFEPEALETIVYSELHKYSGTLDRIGRAKRHRRLLVDIKTGDLRDAGARYQTAAYAYAYCEMVGDFETPISRAAVQLQADGRYKFEPYNDPMDARVFLSAVTVYRHQLPSRRFML